MTDIRDKAPRPVERGAWGTQQSYADLVAAIVG
jgi:hypothetical protein